MQEDALTLRVRVQPRSSSCEIRALADGSLRVRTTAPPTDGKANSDVIRQIAKAYRVPASHVSLLRGAASRDKVLRVLGPLAAPEFSRNGASPGQGPVPSSRQK